MRIADEQDDACRRFLRANRSPLITRLLKLDLLERTVSYASIAVNISRETFPS
jgi:hypothetical protein